MRVNGDRLPLELHSCLVFHLLVIDCADLGETGREVSVHSAEEVNYDLGGCEVAL